MDIAEALKAMLKWSRMTQKSFAEKAGYRTVSCITSPIARKDMKVSTLLKFADTAGYDLMLVKRENVEGYPPIRIDPTHQEVE